MQHKLKLVCVCFCCKQVSTERITLLGMNHILESNLWQIKCNQVEKTFLRVQGVLGKQLLIHLMC